MSQKLKAFKEHRTTDPTFPLMINHRDTPITFPPHYHKQLELIYVTGGTFSVEVNHTLYQLTQGDLLLIGSNHIHAYNNHSDSSDSSYYLMIFDWDYLDTIAKDKHSYDDLYPLLLKQNLFRKGFNPDLEVQLDYLIRSMTKESKEQKKAYKLIAIGHLYEFLTLIARELDHYTPSAQEVKSLQKENQFMSTINDLLYHSYTRKIELNEAATLTGYSVYHFTRLFKKHTGYTFKQYLNNFRIIMVKEDLYDPDLSITDIAYKHGFSSIKSFNRNFKDQTGTSPSAYRKAIFD